MFENEISINVDSRPDFKTDKEYSISENKNGFIEFKRKELIEYYQLNYKKFRVSFYIIFNNNKKIKSSLLIFKEFFDKHQDFLQEFELGQFFYCSFGIFNSRKSLHQNWFYLEFDNYFNYVFSIKELNLFLNKLYIYEYTNSESLTTRFFLKQLTMKSIQIIFLRERILKYYEQQIHNKMLLTKNLFFEKRKNEIFKRISNVKEKL